MSLEWIFRLADRTHFLMLPGLMLLLGGGGYSLLLGSTDLSFAGELFAYRHLVGTLALFVLLPSYLIAMFSLQQRRTQETLVALEDIARPSDVAEGRARMKRAPAYTWLFVGLGLSIGLALNPVILNLMYETGRRAPFDIAFIIGACLLWGIVALLLCWRLPTSLALSRLGANLDLDLYRLDKVRPLARVANADVLTAVGAMAFMPLQSLDAEFRLGNYAVGFGIGTAAVVFLFTVPLWGIHRHIVRAKAARLHELYERIEQIRRDDIPTLETVSSHIERIRTIPNWPVDLQLVTRLFGYVIIPPLAWVAAALVENFVDSF
jgi:hypothetical protein